MYKSDHVSLVLICDAATLTCKISKTYVTKTTIATATTYLICRAGRCLTNPTRRHAWKDLNGLGLAAIAFIRAKRVEHARRNNMILRIKTKYV